MRTDEEILTGVALRAVPCACEEDCRTARRAESDDFAPYYRAGVGSVVSSHETVDDLIACVTSFYARFMESWAAYKMSELIINHNDLVRKFMEFLKEYKAGGDVEVQALRRVVKKLRLYACANKAELQHFAVHKLLFIAAETFAEAYPKYK